MKTIITIDSYRHFRTIMYSGNIVFSQIVDIVFGYKLKM